MSQRNKQPVAPATWNAYERGRSDAGSLSSTAAGESQHEYQGSPSSPTTPRWIRGSDRPDGEHSLRQRNSSVIHSIRQMGGVNNIDNFARSFQRAAGFRQITPARRGSVTVSVDGEEEDFENPSTSGRSLPNRSLLRQQFEAARGEAPEMAVTEVPSAEAQPRATETTALLPSQSRTSRLSFSRQSRTGRLSFSNQSRTGRLSFSARPRLGADITADLGTSFGSISSRLTSTAQRRASILIQQHVEASIRAREAAEDGEEGKDDILDRPVEIETTADGEVIERIVGESTVPMTVFNSINVLIGVGILALPLAMNYTGWVIGLTLLTLPAILTNYTAKLLAKCLDTNSGSNTYGDLAFLAFGDVGRAIVETLFVLELIAANVALYVLFGISMHSLIPSVSNLVWKTILAVALMPLNHVPFKTLSLTSVLGITCTMGIILVTFVDGLIKQTKPGSLMEMMPTHAFPENYKAVPLSIGLYLAPWGGHSVFPNIYKDMRHPKKYPKALTYSYVATYGLDLVMSVFGYLMFGKAVKDAVSSNLISDPAYPKPLSILLVVLICIIPATKVPLSNRPIMDTINKKFMIDLRQMDAKARKYSEASWNHRMIRASIGIGCNISELMVSILIPEFDSIMATMGASFCLTLCVILPVAFYLKIFNSEGNTISKSERIMDFVILAIAITAAVIGTLFAMIPKKQLGIIPCDGLACLG